MVRKENQKKEEGRKCPSCGLPVSDPLRMKCPRCAAVLGACMGCENCGACKNR